MKILLLAAGFALLGQATLARPLHSLSTSADTVEGHARMVRRMSQEMCAALNADHTTNFQAMTKEQGIAYIQKLLMPALMRDSTNLMKMAQLGAQQNLSPHDIGRMVGQDAFVELRHSCPAVLPLANLFAQPPVAAPAPATAPKRQPAARPAGKK